MHCSAAQIAAQRCALRIHVYQFLLHVAMLTDVQLVMLWHES